jgi:hypothetical protein
MIDDEINKLAAHIVKLATASGDGTPSFIEKVDALKVLTAYSAMIRKFDNKPDDTEEEATFGSMVAQINNAENKGGGSKVRGN